jgi:hypothetical protein
VLVWLRLKSVCQFIVAITTDILWILEKMCTGSLTTATTVLLGEIQALDFLSHKRLAFACMVLRIQRIGLVLYAKSPWMLFYVLLKRLPLRQLPKLLSPI